MGARGNFGIGRWQRCPTIGRDGLHHTIHSTHSAASFPALYTNFRYVRCLTLYWQKGRTVLDGDPLMSPLSQTSYLHRYTYVQNHPIDFSIRVGY